MSINTNTLQKINLMPSDYLDRIWYHRSELFVFKGLFISFKRKIFRIYSQNNAIDRCSNICLCGVKLIKMHLDDLTIEIFVTRESS